MANTLGGYELIWFTQTFISQLQKKLGMAARVHRGYSPDATQKGKTVRINTLSGMTVNDFGTGAVDLDAGSVDIVLDQHKEVHFAIKDSELHYSPDRIISDHIQPSAHKLARELDEALMGLYVDVPWSVDVDTTAGNEKNNIINPWEVLADNDVDVEDTGNVFLGLRTGEVARIKKSDILDATTVGDQAAALMNLRGSVGMYGGMNIFRHGSVQQHASGTVVSVGTDVAGALNGAVAKGATSAPIDGLSGTETLAVGDSFVIAGNTQRYVITAAATLSTGAATVSFAPAAVQAYADNAVVTFEDGTATNADAYYANPAFHRGAFALATAPLQDELATEQARRQGYEVEVVTDPQTNIAIRFMKWYDAQNATGLNIRADILYGVKTLDPNKAVILRSDV